MTPTTAMAKTVPVDRKAIVDLQRIKEDFALVVESIELQSDKAAMKSHKNARRQVTKREFGDWDAL